MSCRFWVMVFFVVPLMAMASLAKDRRDELSAKLDKALATSACKANVGITIYDAITGSTVYDRNGHSLFVPASGLKLYTAAAALDVLGPDYTLATELWICGEVVDGTLQGSIYLKGGGDPGLSGSDLEKMAAELKALGISKIDGQVFVDNFAFDGVSQGPGWMWDDAPEYWNSTMDALVVNHSCMTLQLSPALKEGEPCSIRVLPETEFVSVANLSTTVQAKEHAISCMRQVEQSSNAIKVVGAMAIQGPRMTVDVALEHPHLYAGHLFVAALNRVGIATSTKEVHACKVPENARATVKHRSRPIAELIQKMMKNSDNLYADCLFKATACHRYARVGSWSMGSRAVREVLLKRFGLANEDMAILDGSGLSRYNLTSPQQLASFLLAAKKDFPYFAELQASLPLYHGAAVRAKSGSMQGIKTLSGFVKTQNGRELVFSLMMNGFLEPRPMEGRLEDEVLKIIVKY